MSNGWIMLHRVIEDWKFYFDEPFTKASAWIDLILLANHKEGSFSLRGNLVIVKRGEVAWAEESLAKRWKWSKGKVRRYLIMLKMEQQIEQQKSFILNKIIILNYDRYQQNDTADSTADGQQTVQQTDTNNKNNKNKNEKNDKKNNKNTLMPDSPIALDFLSYFNLKTKKELSLTKDRKELVERLLKEGRTIEQLKKAVDNFILDDWPDRYKFVDFIYCIGTIRKINNLDRWLDYKPKGGNNGTTKNGSTAETSDRGKRLDALAKPI